jgi:hypothetical protein
MPTIRSLNLSPAEAALVNAFVAGQPSVVNSTSPNPATHYPTESAWPRASAIRGELIAELLQIEDPAEIGLSPGSAVPRKLVIANAQIIGNLDLSLVEGERQLVLARCWVRVDAPIEFSSASFRSVRIHQSRIESGVEAGNLRISHDLLMDETAIQGQVVLINARIGGSFSLDGSILRPPEGAEALIADGVSIGGRAGMDELRAEGEVRLLRASISGEISLNDAALENRGQDALSLDGATVQGGLFAHRISVHGAMRLPGAQVSGQLVLTDARLRFPHGDTLNFTRARIDGDLFCNRLGSVGRLNLSNVHIVGSAIFTEAELSGVDDDSLNGESMRIDGDLQAAGINARGAIRMTSARIGGRVVLGGAIIDAAESTAIDAGQAQLGGDLQLQHVSVSGQVQLGSTTVAGDVVLISSRIDNRSGVALAADRIKISGRLLAARMTCFGDVRAPGASIEGQAILAESSFYGSIYAFAADGAHFASDLVAEGVETNGEFRIQGARVNGQLVLTSAVLRNGGDVALNLDGLQLDEELLLEDGFAADGVVRLNGASIDTVSVSGARFRNPGSVAISAESLKVRGSFAMFGRSSISGEVRLLDASVTGQLSLEGAHLFNPNRVSLLADGLHAGNLRLGQGFVSDGGIRLVGARISSQCSFNGAVIKNSGDRAAVEAQNIGVGGTLFWAPREMEGSASFAFSSIAIWSDTPRSLRYRCSLSGARFGQLSAGPDQIPVAARIQWLRNDPAGYTPASFKHLAERMRDGGHDREARHLLIVSEHLRRLQSGSRRTAPLHHVASTVMRWTVGYGYRPLLAVLWLAGLICLASYGLGRLPAGPLTHFQQLQGAPTPFNPFLYSLDTVLPFIDLGYNRWVPEGPAQVITVVLVLLGWALATAVVTALAGLFRKAD